MVRKTAVLALLLAAVWAVAVDHEVRPPMGLQFLYPSSAEALRAAVQQYIDEAAPVQVPGRVVGCVVPNLAMQISGKVAGSAYKAIEPGAYNRVILLAPSHVASFRGCSLPRVTDFMTPIGLVPLDTKSMAKLSVSPLFELRRLVYGGTPYTSPGNRWTPLHESEYAVEVALPYLQHRLGTFTLLPVLVGEFKTVKGEPDDVSFSDAVRRLRECIDGRTLIVASVEFTRFGSKYKYEPFTEDVPAQLAKLDQDAIRHIVNRDAVGLDRYMRDTGNNLHSATTLALFMALLPETALGLPLDNDTSARASGDYDHSVSFASIAFYNPTRPAPADLAATP